MRLTAIARWIMAKVFKTSPEQEFVNKALAEVQSLFEIGGTLTVVDAQGRVK